MLKRCKTAVANACYDLFSMDKWAKKSRHFAYILCITFVMALSAIIAVIFAYIDIHVWSKNNKEHVYFVSQDHLVNIDGEMYIPVKVFT